MKSFIITSLFIIFPLIANAQFTINGKKAIYDKLTNTYLVSIEESSFGQDYEANIALDPDSLWNDFSIENTPVTEKYIFSNIQPNKSYNIQALRNGQGLHTNISFTYLPIIDMKGDFGYEYQKGSINIYTPDTQVSSLIKAKWRGGSTNAEDRHKRNYKIKTINAEGKSEDISFLGLRNDNNWILDAGQIDLFRLRNRTATELWNDMAAKPYYADKEPKAKTGVAGKIAEVFINNEYKGIYSLTEAMDRKEMKLKKYDEKKQEFHGMLWKASSWGNSLFWGVEEEYDNNKETWNAFEVKYPDIEDVCPTNYGILYDAINFVATSDDESFKQNVSSYFDIPVLIDYYILLEILNAVDNTGKNMYWAVYDQASDKKLTLAVWDLDTTVGGNYTTNPLHPDYVSPTNELSINNFYIYNRLIKLNVDNFNEKVEQRYKALRQNLLSKEALQERYLRHYQTISNSGAAAREEKRWSKDSDLSGNELNFEQEIAYINQWIDKRIDYLDSKDSPFTTSIKEVSISKDNVHPKIYNMLGQKLNAIPSKTGIYIINGKKYIIK